MISFDIAFYVVTDAYKVHVDIIEAHDRNQQTLINVSGMYPMFPNMPDHIELSEVLDSEYYHWPQLPETTKPYMSELWLAIKKYCLARNIPLQNKFRS